MLKMTRLWQAFWLPPGFWPPPGVWLPPVGLFCHQFQEGLLLPQPLLPQVSSERWWALPPPPQVLVHSVTWRTTCITAPGRWTFTAAIKSWSWLSPIQAGARSWGQARANIADALLLGGRAAGA